MTGLCARCRRLVSEGTKRGMQRAKARGASVGRPKLVLRESDLARVLAGELTVDALARKLGCSPMTVRRRLRALRERFVWTP